MPFIVIACYAGAIYLSGNRRRGFVESAIAFAIGALDPRLALLVGRGAYLNAATGNELPYDAAAAMYDTLLRFLLTSVRAVPVHERDRHHRRVLRRPVAIRRLVPAAGAAGRELARPPERSGGVGVARAQRVRGAGRSGGCGSSSAALAFIVLSRWKPSDAVDHPLHRVGHPSVLGVIEFFGREPLPGRGPGPGDPGVAAGATPVAARADARVRRGRCPSAAARMGP